MTLPWRAIAAVGSFFTLVAVAPYLLGMGSLLSNASIQSADIEGTYQMINLAVSAIKTLVPLTVGGALLFVVFLYAGERA